MALTRIRDRYNLTQMLELKSCGRRLVIVVGDLKNVRKRQYQLEAFVEKFLCEVMDKSVSIQESRPIGLDRYLRIPASSNECNMNISSGNPQQDAIENTSAMAQNKPLFYLPIVLSISTARAIICMALVFECLCLINAFPAASISSLSSGGTNMESGSKHIINQPSDNMVSNSSIYMDMPDWLLT